MLARPGPWLISLVLILLCAVVLATSFIFGSLWITASLTAILIVAAYLLARKIISSYADISIISNLTKLQPQTDNAIAYKLLAESLLAGSDKRPFLAAAQELIKENLRLDKFVIFTREDDRFIPRILAGLNRNSLASPQIHRLSNGLKRGMPEGVFSTLESDVRLAYKNGEIDNMSAPVAFVYSWGRGRAVLVIADDPHGDLTQLAKDAEL